VSSTSASASSVWTTAPITTRPFIAPFSDFTSYVNFTVGNHSMFDGTKISLSADNLLNQHNIDALTLAGSPNTIYLNARPPAPLQPRAILAMPSIRRS